MHGPILLREASKCNPSFLSVTIPFPLSKMLAISELSGLEEDTNLNFSVGTEHTLQVRLICLPTSML